jgi:diguanylate cyclase (GGDEF)-like protein
MLPVYAKQVADSEFSVIANERLLSSMRQMDRRGWRLWFCAIAITLMLAIGISSFALPKVLADLIGFQGLSLDNTVRALWGLLLIFNFYVVYEQIRINRIRQEFAGSLYQMAVLDPVTDMFNRRYIMQRLQEEIARCQRSGSPLTVIVFDLDSFKNINDEHGHAIGDSVLRAFGEQLKRATRGSDVVARYGGDEFLAILPDCSLEQIHYVIRRLNELHLKNEKTTIKIMYSADYIPGESAADLINRADEMLYENKRNPKQVLVGAMTH